MTADYREDRLSERIEERGGGQARRHRRSCSFRRARRMVSRSRPTDLTNLLLSADEADPLLNQLGMCVHKWDTDDEAEAWTEGTPPSSTGRRQVICRLLGIDDAGSALRLAGKTTDLSRRQHRDQRAVGTLVHKRAGRRTCLLLAEVPRLPADRPESGRTRTLRALHHATSRVIERIADPVRPAHISRRDLVCRLCTER